LHLQGDGEKDSYALASGEISKLLPSMLPNPCWRKDISWPQIT
jgi:hypothetical protein